MKTTKFLSGLILLFSVSILTSCSIDKRLYTSGYDVKWHSKNMKQNEENNNLAIFKNIMRVNEQIPISPIIQRVPEIDNTISASMNEQEIVMLKKENIIPNQISNIKTQQDVNKVENAKLSPNKVEKNAAMELDPWEIIGWFCVGVLLGLILILIVS